MKNVAIIAARGGSKGIPKKNITEFCGKPLIYWTIDQCRKTQRIDEIFVTSDDDEILSVSESFGASAIKRPENISDDLATSESAWLHAIESIESRLGEVGLVVAAQATSPVRTSQDFDAAIETFQENQLDSLFSATPIEDFFIWKKNSSGKFLSENYDYLNRSRRQDTEKKYVENGSFYVFKPEILKKENNRLGGKIGIHEMEFWKTFEIDDSKSLDLCQAMMKYFILDRG